MELRPRLTGCTGAGSGTRITSDRGEVAELSSTSDGKFLAVRRLVPQHDVYVAELRDGGKRLSTPQRLTLDERQDYPYSWTADSKAVIFASDRDGPWHIFKQSIDQTAARAHGWGIIRPRDTSVKPR